MATTPEGKVKARVRAIINKHPSIYSFWPVPSGYGESSVDCILCLRGRFIGVEVKAPGKRPTARQQTMLERISTAGGQALVVGTDEELELLDATLNAIANEP